MVSESSPPCVSTTIWPPVTAANVTVTVLVPSPVAPAMLVWSTAPPVVITKTLLVVSD